MHNGMTLQEMLTEVVRHNETKQDYIASTEEHIAMVPMPNAGLANDIALVLSRPESAELERFGITENFHRQVAARLQIPSKYYFRLMEDHRDLLLTNVNALFNREPQLRMVRTLDGKARAFLSQQFRRVDNEQILESTLPVIRSDFDTTILNTYVDENRMKFKCLFNGDDHMINLGPSRRTGGDDEIVHTGFEMGNSEVGGGSFYVRGFTYTSYCLNGCVFGGEEIASFKQIHVGSKLGIHEGMLLSQETMRKEDELIISAAKDVLSNLASPKFTEQVGNKLRALRNTKTVADPHAAVEAVTKELRLSETQSRGVLESFIRDQDYSQWGMLQAVTEQANTEKEYMNASHLEELGNKIINLPANRWTRIAESVAIAA
jgi:hypothetical protein